MRKDAAELHLTLSGELSEEQAEALGELLAVWKEDVEREARAAQQELGLDRLELTVGP